MNIAQDIVKQRKLVFLFRNVISIDSTKNVIITSTVEFFKIEQDYESSNDDTRAVTQAIDMMQDCSMYIDDTGSITPMTSPRARRMKRN